MSVSNRLGIWLAVVTILATTAGIAAEPSSSDVTVSLEQGFVQPPEAARPWVYWFWLNGNITREGITADLEAMRRAGIGGGLIMEVDQGAPVGPADFMSPKWRELFRHVHDEANRLGLEINMNDDAGWNGSGGPWIKPEESMQKVVWTETLVEGPRRYEGDLPQPATVAGTLAVIALSGTILQGITRKSVMELAPELGDEVVMQIGAGSYEPRHASEWFRYAPSLEGYYDRAEIIVHRGQAQVTAKGSTVVVSARERTSVPVGEKPEPPVPAARDLVEKRDAWLNPAGAGEAALKTRTLTNLYNQRPTWLDLAHRALDEAVFDAYGWPHDLTDDEILERLLALNLQRAAQS